MARGETERRVESLARLVNEANALALVGSREHGIEVQINLDPTATMSSSIASRSSRCSFNLIRNAIEAMLESAGAVL